MQITTDKNLQFHFAGYKLLFWFVISVFGLIFAAFFVFADTSSDIAAKVVPIFLLTVFGVSTLTSLVRFVQSDLPVMVVGPAGILDSRRVTSAIPWTSIQQIKTRRSRHVWYIVLYVDKKEYIRFRRLSRWFRRLNRFWGYGDLAIPANGLEVSQDTLKVAIEIYARAHGAPAAREWD